MNKQRIVSLLIALNLFLTSCSREVSNNTNNKNMDDGKIDNYQEDVIESPKDDVIVDNFSYDELAMAQFDKDFLKQKVTIDDWSSFISYLDNTKVVYPYQELFTKDYDLVIPQTFEDTEIPIIVNGQVDYDILLNKVLENNQEYIQNNSNFSNTTTSLVERVCHIISDYINSEIQNNHNINLIDLNIKLNDLKILSYSSFGYGYYNQEYGILGIDENSLAQEDDKILADIINHEVVHIIQSASVKELENSDYLNRNGFLYQTKTQAINPYNWLWFSEASAESLSYTYQGLDEPYVYGSEIKALEFIKLASFKPSKELEKSLFSSNMEPFYNYFGVTTPEEKESINKLFYALTIVYNNSPGKEGRWFYNTLEELGYGIHYTEIESFETEVKGSIALELSKVFYRNLIQNIGNKEVMIEDIFKVISIFELETSRFLWYESKYADLEYFLKEYTTMQDSFWSSLAKNLGVEIEYLQNLYYLYNRDIEIKDISISWLDEDSNAYLNYINNSRVGNKKDAIFKIYDTMFTNNYAK